MAENDIEKISNIDKISQENSGENKLKKQDIKKLEEDVIAVEDQLNKYIEDEEEYDRIFQQSVLTDQVISKYLNAKRKLEEERKILIKDYSNVLNTPFREEVTNQIIEEVKKDFPSVSANELHRFSDNVYIYATLDAHNVDKQDIINQLLYLNNRYFDFMQEKGEIEGKQHITNNLDYLKKLNEKYHKIIKEKID